MPQLSGAGVSWPPMVTTTHGHALEYGLDAENDPAVVDVAEAVLVGVVVAQVEADRVGQSEAGAQVPGRGVERTDNLLMADGARDGVLFSHGERDVHLVIGGLAGAAEEIVRI